MRRSSASAASQPAAAAVRAPPRPATVYNLAVKRKPVPKLDDFDEAQLSFSSVKPQRSLSMSTNTSSDCDSVHTAPQSLPATSPVDIAEQWPPYAAFARPQHNRRPSVSASSLASVGEGAENIEGDLLDAWMELMGPAAGAEVDPTARRYGRRGSERLKSVSEESGVALSGNVFPSAGGRNRRSSIYSGGSDQCALPSPGSPLRKDSQIYTRSIASSISVALSDVPCNDDLAYARDRRMSSTASTASSTYSSAAPCASAGGRTKKEESSGGFFGGFSWSAAGNSNSQAKSKTAPGPKDTPSSFCASSDWNSSKSTPATECSASVSSYKFEEPVTTRKSATGGLGYSPATFEGQGPRRSSASAAVSRLLGRKANSVSAASVRTATDEEIANSPPALRANRSASVPGLMIHQRHDGLAQLDSAPGSRNSFYSPFDPASSDLAPLFSHKPRTAPTPPSLVELNGEPTYEQWAAMEKRRRSSAGLVTKPAKPIKSARQGSITLGIMEEDYAF